MPLKFTWVLDLILLSPLQPIDLLFLILFQLCTQRVADIRVFLLTRMCVCVGVLEKNTGGKIL